MDPANLLYLRLKLEQKDDYLDLQLQKRGFKLTKKTGEGLESFRNYYYEMTGAASKLEVSFKLMPGKNTTQTISLSLSTDIDPKHIKSLFENIKELSTRMPLDLLDLKRRNIIYEKLHKEGKVNAFYVGLDKEEQLKVEEQAYIPLDSELFLEQNNMGYAEESNEDKGGERAPDLDA